jgi:poly[(R)-3-hydroxyalkanoate] polymerase subunit PhaC
VTRNPIFQLFQLFFDLIVTINKEILERFSGEDGQKFLEQLTRIWQAWLQHASQNSQPLETLIAQQREQMMGFMDNMPKGENSQASQDAYPFPLDPRFADKDWQDNPFFVLLRQSYFIFSENLMSTPESLPLSSGEKKKLKFYSKFFIDAICPTNFFMTNPEVIRQAVETKGQSLMNGLENLTADIEKGRISMTDESAFELGKNIATSPGAVVYENDIMQLIQYTPATKFVSERPLLVIPPCINKYYVLDLQPENSFVKYCLDLGYAVFVISWVNPDARHRALGWDDYIERGVLKAIDVTNDIGGSKKLNAFSWCIGGTFLATALAVLHGRKKPTGVSSATFLTTLLDFSNPGDLGVFIEDTYTEDREAYALKNGFFPGEDLSLSFSLLRANELIWSFVINNYLKGNMPAPFDILYWNSDSTNLPVSMYNYYLRYMYLENKLVEPNGLSICNVPVNLKNIKTPSYIFSAIDDHIAPWETTFLNTDLLSGPNEFVLGTSGHVAGVINPPIQNKRSYWADGEMGKGPSHWLKTSISRPGSWWTHWQKWLKKRAGKKISAPEKLGNNTYPVIESAPGRYVRKRI